MRWLIRCYALLGLLWFGYLNEWRVAALWLVLMLLARLSLQMRRALQSSASAWSAWREYVRQSRDHLVVTGWKVVVFFVGAGLIQAATIGFDRETLQGLYAQSKSFSDLIWWLSPLVHSSLLHWFGNTVVAMLVLVAFPRIRCQWMIAWGIGAALSVSLFSQAFSWLTEMEHAVVGSSAGIAGMIGAGGALGSEKPNHLSSWFSSRPEYSVFCRFCCVEPDGRTKVRIGSHHRLANGAWAGNGLPAQAIGP